MSKKPNAAHVLESARRRPVLFDVDVAVAGSGLCSTFAAIASGRCGAKTLLIERTAMLGGNLGPGMILGGTIDGEADTTLPGGMAGISREFFRRLKALRAGRVQDHRLGKPQGEAFRQSAVSIYPEDANIASYVLGQMLQEAGVEILLSAYASDPILRGKRVRGLFVECKGGRAAVLAKVTVDGTGDADIARRASAPIVPYLRIRPGEGPDERYKTAHAPEGMIRDAFMQRRWPTHYNDTLLLTVVANVDRARYRRFFKNPARLSAADRKVVQQHFHHLPPAFWPALVKTWRDGTLPIWKVTPEERVSVAVCHLFDYGIGTAAFWLTCLGALDAGNPVQVSRLERELRQRVFESVCFLRKHIGGFEEAYLLCTQPYLGFRGGPRIEGKHTLTVEEMFAETRFDDVLYRNIHEMNHGGPRSGYDVPYGCILPKKVEGLLVCGRGAAYERRGHDPSSMRCRPAMMVFGQCAGTAAAIAALDGVAPGRVDMRKVQRRLVKDGIFLGEKKRLHELGIG